MFTKNSKTAPRGRKRQDMIQFIALVAVLILLNVISSYIFHRFDLTSEKRYTLSQSTRQLLKKLDDIIYVKVYLDGEFPAGFKKLRNSTKEMLDEFRSYAKGKIEYEFIDPTAISDIKQRNEFYQQLMNKGLKPTNLQEKGKSDYSERIIFPGALVSFRDREVPMQLLKSQIGAQPDVMINNSIESLEYELANSIREVSQLTKKVIGFVQGHKELNRMQVADFAGTLSDYYDVDSVSIRGQLNSLKGFDAIVIAKPDTLFSEKDKFIIDQFIMKGGKVLWLIDPMIADLDSLNKTGGMFSYGRSVNLDDQLFKYGVRLNYNLVQDLQAAPIPIVVGSIGNQPQQRLMPWPYSPLIFPGNQHPIVNDLNAIKGEFMSTIDTVGPASIKKTVLLSSSEYTKVLNSPVRVDINMLRVEPDPKQFNKKFQPLAVLLEGKFTSVFKNRLTPLLALNSDIDFREKSGKNKMIVIGDGDMIRNNVKMTKKGPMITPLGFDKYTREEYGNKAFLLNCIDYLCDDSGLIGIRGKELKLRILNKAKVDEEKLFWQIINVTLPLVLVIIYAIIQVYRRKRKFAH